jgi:hypothetical protein
MAGTNTVRFAFSFCPAVGTITQGESVPVNSSHSPEWTHILRSRRKRTDKLEAFAGTERADSN